MERSDAQRKVAEDIGALRDLDAPALRRRWRVLTGRSLPEHLPPSIVRRMVAYRIQTDAFADLDAKTARALDRIAKQRAGEEGKPTLEALGLSSRNERTLTPGTIFVREHDGVHHHVMVLEQGFAWGGITYGSLSEVARAITGTRWNGPRFFGLSPNKTEVRRR
jgi:hypothetical protein